MVNDRSVNDDTWDTAFIAAAFVSWHTEPSADDSYIPMTEDEAQEVFDRWLNARLAGAWDLARSEVRSIPSWYNRETGKGGFDLQPLGPDQSSEEGAWDAVMEILDNNLYRKAD